LAGTGIQLVCEITDKGTPARTSYLPAGARWTGF